MDGRNNINCCELQVASYKFDYSTNSKTKQIKGLRQLLRKLLFLHIIFVLCSCVDDYRKTNMVDDAVYIKDNELNKVSVFNWGNYDYDLIVIKSGIGQQRADVELVVKEELLLDYNNSNSTHYKLLPSEYYTILNNKITFNKNDYSASYRFVFNSTELEKLLKNSLHEYAIPCELVLSNTDIRVASSENIRSILVPQIKEPYIGFEIAGLLQPNIKLNPTSIHSLSVSSIVEVNYSNKFGKIPFKIISDPQVLVNYNASVGDDKKINYPLLPSEFFQFEEESWLIAQDERKTHTFLNIFRDAFKNGNSYYFGDYILPLKIVSAGRFGVDPQKEFQLIHISFQPIYLDRKSWKVIEVSSEEPSDGGGKDAVIDGKGETYWHSKWINDASPLPHYLTIDMQKTHEVVSIELMRRVNNKDTKLVKFELSEDGISFSEVGLMDFGDYSSTIGNTQSISIIPQKARYLKCIVIESNNLPIASIAEIHVRGIE